MKRRNFLSLLGAAGTAPLLPLPANAASASLGYNRYMYGLAVFHARTRASLSVADLVTWLRVSTATAEAMMGEMSARGVLVPALNAASGTMRAVSPTSRPASAIARKSGAAVRQFLRPDENTPPPCLDADQPKGDDFGSQPCAGHVDHETRGPSS